MYYNTRTAQLLPACPETGFTSDGALVVSLDLGSPELQADCGIVPVISDEPPQPEGTKEKVSERVVAVGPDGASVVRTWVEIPVYPPATVSARQIRLWLVTHGIPLTTVASAIAAIEDPALREVTQIEWEFAPYVERVHPMVDALSAALGLTPEQTDQAFVEASRL